MNFQTTSPGAAPVTRPADFRTARRLIQVGDPGRFLRLMEGQARGFWARGPRWVAHAGILGQVTAEPGPGRFRQVERAARAWEAQGDGEEALRFYGGFSFREEHEAGGHWDGFPAALFHLPAVEFDGEGTGVARLRVRIPVGDDPEAAQARAESVADDLVRRLAEVPTGANGAGAPASVTAAQVEGARDAWLDAVRETLDAIEEGRFTKAVLARTRDVALAGEIGVIDVLMALWNQHHRAHAFLFEPEPGRRLLGAAPEVLVTLRDGRISATAVAGSVRRGQDEAEDRSLAGSLLASRKDRAEHHAVVEAMVRHLNDLAADVTVQDEPHILALARIQHLETEVGARAVPGLSALRLVERLHPTPAVCGVPRDRALRFLGEAEPFERGWYAGPVGWFDTEGEGHFVPALRTAVAVERRWRLFAGAGIVDGSEPESEWDETGIKFQPVLRALASAGVVLDGLEP